ncbi:MAG: RluA family pseudouridine synthase, partial [Oscillospiraceae bacterium]|nr:RluA family pseudouridine synthase [Oscillospiraceae bacterium]
MNIRLEILFENDDLVFVVKPSGISSEEETVTILKEQLGSEIYPLHRLDKPVSGVMVYAKTKEAAARMSAKI